MAKVALIIPFYCQTKNLGKVLAGLEKQTTKPDTIFIVVDRPEDDPEYGNTFQSIVDKSALNINVIKSTNPKHIGNRPDEGKTLFLAPHVRNQGIDKALKSGHDAFIFIDGDCVPQPTLIESHLKKLSSNVPVMSIGRRREKQYRWMDRREFESNLCHLEIFREHGMIVNNPELLKNSLIVWSCNVGMNAKAVKLLRNFNKKYYSRYEVFCSEFNGKWGGEDGFLGIEAWHCRIFITTLGERGSGIEHIDHPRPSDVYSISHKEFFDKEMSALRTKVQISPLDLNFFNV